mmetsp:Transcript_21130/g.53706  ORF Transcript_21130/g.53706 Transcript_21130/m.53706 type:complete len:267 (-) Transcript_21130:1120-1920(-)
MVGSPPWQPPLPPKSSASYDDRYNCLVPTATESTASLVTRSHGSLMVHQSHVPPTATQRHACLEECCGLKPCIKIHECCELESKANSSIPSMLTLTHVCAPAAADNPIALPTCNIASIRIHVHLHCTDNAWLVPTGTAAGLHGALRALVGGCHSPHVFTAPAARTRPGSPLRCNPAAASQWGSTPRHRCRPAPAPRAAAGLPLLLPWLSCSRAGPPGTGPSAPHPAAGCAQALAAWARPRTAPRPTPWAPGCPPARWPPACRPRCA